MGARKRGTRPFHARLTAALARAGLDRQAGATQVWSHLQGRGWRHSRRTVYRWLIGECEPREDVQAAILDDLQGIRT